MKIPKIIYHGTSMMRWASMKNDKAMKCQTSKFFASDNTKSMGYLFFTDEPFDALMYGLSTSLIDQQFLKDPQLKFGAFMGRDPVILALKTSGIAKDRIDIDPDGPKHNKDFAGLKIKYGVPHGTALGDLGNVSWFRIKGDIDIKHVFAYRQSPFDQIDKETIQLVQIGIIMTDLREHISEIKQQ